MGEHETYTGEMTVIELIFEGKNLGKITVPFSHDEVARIEKMREARETLGKEAMRGSSIIRDLYLDGGIPWGYTLADRKKSIEEMEKTSKRYKAALNEERFSGTIAPFRDKLEEIDDGLRSFFEEKD